MKMTIMVDRTGDIIATSHIAQEERKSEDAPSEVGISPQPGQKIYEVEIPDHLGQTEALHELHTHFKLKITKSKVELVKRQPQI
jgi:hypothetical protein